MTEPASGGGPAGDRDARAAGDRGAGPVVDGGAGPANDRDAGAGRPLLLGDEDLLAILEEAIADERAAQEKYSRGLERCADPAACEMFEQLLREERAHEKALEARYVEVKKRIGLHGAGRS